MNRFVRLTERISDVAAWISALILGAICLLILTEILLWNTLEKTTLVADEYSAYGLAAITFLGAGYCLKERGHIRLTLVLALLPARAARILTWLSTVLATVFMAYLWWYLGRMVLSSYRYGSTSGTLTATPLWIPQAFMLAGMSCFLFQFLGMAVKTYLAIGTGEEVV